MIRRAAAWLAAAGLALAPLPAAAHRGHGALSVVEINARTGQVTVTHRAATHDAEPALAAIAPDAQTSLDDPDSIAALRTYMARRFSLTVDDAPVALTLRDMTLGADEIRFDYVGQIPPTAATGRITIAAPMFADIYADQVNQVNIRRLGVTRTLLFSGAEAVEPQSLDPLDAPSPAAR